MRCSVNTIFGNVPEPKMSNDPTTSDDVKSVHQQRITPAKVDAALARAESPSGAINEGDAGLLAAEVRWQRELVESANERTRRVIRITALLLGVDAEKTVAALQEWDTEMPKLRAKLARVEAECAASDDAGDPLVSVSDIRRALCDPQPSAAPTPKGEPYNGY